jgi:hypothetical protein
MDAPKARPLSVSGAKRKEKKRALLFAAVGPRSRREYEGEAGTPILHRGSTRFLPPTGDFVRG